MGIDFNHFKRARARVAGYSDGMLEQVYNKEILRLAADIPLTRRLPAPDASATAVSRLCGSRVVVDIKMDGGVVSDFGHDVKACALGQASSSIMARHIIGSSADELRDVGAVMRRMLHDNGPPPGGKWAALAILEPVRDFKARHASTLLTFDAVAKAIAEIESNRKPDGADAQPSRVTA